MLGDHKGRPGKDWVMDNKEKKDEVVEKTTSTMDINGASYDTEKPEDIEKLIKDYKNIVKHQNEKTIEKEKKVEEKEEVKTQVESTPSNNIDLLKGQLGLDDEAIEQLKIMANKSKRVNYLKEIVKTLNKSYDNGDEVFENITKTLETGHQSGLIDLSVLSKNEKQLIALVEISGITPIIKQETTMAVEKSDINANDVVQKQTEIKTEEEKTKPLDGNDVVSKKMRGEQLSIEEKKEWAQISLTLDDEAVNKIIKGNI